MRTYFALLRMPGVLRLVVSATPGRMAYNMIGLATFFYVHGSTESLTLAGLATGAETMASSLTAGFRGQFIDKYGQTRPLSVFVPTWVVVLSLLTTQHSHTGILIVSAVVGVSSPPINLSARPLWRAAVGADNLRTAYALDTTMMHLATIVGPLAATALALSLSPSIALWTTAALMLVGGTAMITMPLSRRWVPEVAVPGAPRLLRNRPYVLVAIEGIIFGAGWGLLEITIPSMSTQVGRPGWSAPLLATYAAMAVVGGIAVGSGRFRATPLRGFRNAQVFVTLAAAPLAASTPGWSMGALLALLGLSVGFAQVYHWEVVEAVRPVGAATAAQAWLWTMEGSAIAVGSAAGGYLVEHVSARLSLAGVSLSFAAATAFVWVYASRYLSAADRPLTDDEKTEAIVDLEPANE